MKKLLTVFSIISMIFLVSCGKNLEEKTEINEENIIIEEINIDDIYEFSDNEEDYKLENQENTQNRENENTNINTESNSTIEIEEEVSEMTEEEILKDIDALINDIINSTTND